MSAPRSPRAAETQRALTIILNTLMAGGCNLEFDYDRFEPAVHQQVQDYLDFIGKHTQGKSLLDVGTGSGLLPQMARTHGYEVEGTDLSKHVTENVPAKGRIFPSTTARISKTSTSSASMTSSRCCTSWNTPAIHSRL